MEQTTTSADDGINSAAFMEAKINKLKGRLQETLARSHAPAHWEGMLEDCEIILNHLDAKAKMAGEKNKSQFGHATVISTTIVRECANP